MTASQNLSKTVVNDLYEQALLLADEARAVFDLRASQTMDEDEDLVRIALSIEGLKTTTRVMHSLAWLLNQRAHMAGELSDLQLERCGDLPESRPADPAQLDHLLPETRALIRETEALHARVARLDAQQRELREQERGPVPVLQSRIATAFAASA